ncbi:MAG: lysostaphin resistance A-like protein [Crocinitomicaceae bacterium]
MRFIDLGRFGENGAASYVLTIAIIFLSYVIGSFGLFIDYNLHTSLDGTGSSMSDFIVVLGENRVLFWLMFPFILVFISFLLALKYIHKRNIKTIFTGRTSFDWKRTLISFFLIVTVLSVTTFFEIFYSNSYQLNFDVSKFLVLLIIAFLIIPVQTTIEEVIFRGYLMQGLKMKIGSNKHAVILSGIMFGMMHLGNPEIEAIGNHVIIYYVASGVFLGLLALYDNGLELSIGYHAANNIFTALMVSNNWQVFQTNAVFVNTAPPEISWIDLVISLSIFPILFLIYKKIFKWSSLKETWNETN